MARIYRFIVFWLAEGRVESANAATSRFRRRKARVPVLHTTRRKVIFVAAPERTARRVWTRMPRLQRSGSSCIAVPFQKATTLYGNELFCRQ